MNTSTGINIKTLSAVLGVLFLIALTLSYAEEELPVPVNAKLISEVQTVNPGKPFKLGVLFEIIPGWHIYWKNSGDTGLPTKIEFELPPGFSTGELKWPLPNIYRSAGDITDYGYEDSVLLFAEVNAPQDLRLNSELDIKALVSWVSCEEICIPGRAELELTLPVTENSEPANQKLFTKWQKALPLEASESGSPFDVNIKSTSEDNGELVRITLLHNNTAHVKEIIPAPGDDASVSNIKIETNDAGKDQTKTDIELVKKALAGSGSKDSELELLVVYENESEQRSGVEIIISTSDLN